MTLTCERCHSVEEIELPFFKLWLTGGLPTAFLCPCCNEGQAIPWGIWQMHADQAELVSHLLYVESKL